METNSEWNYAVVGCDKSYSPHYLGFFKHYKDAVQFSHSAECLGWQNLGIFDSGLTQVS